MTDSPFVPPVSPRPEIESLETPPSRIPTSGNSLLDSPPLTLPSTAFSNGPTAPRPRRWTVFAVIVAGVISTMLAAGVLVGLLAVIQFGPAGAQQPGVMRKLAGTPAGFLALVVLPQFALIVPAMVAAIASPLGTRERLGLVRGGWPIWAWLAAAMAAPVVGIVSGSVLSLVLEQSESLKQMGDSFRAVGRGWFGWVVALAVGMVPAICEEILFRGYAQTRLVRSFPPVVGILIASALFAAFHLDFVHAITVFPLGVYLGVISYRSGSLFPAMMGHFLNNFISVSFMVFGMLDESGNLPDPPNPAVAASAMAVMIGGLMGVAGTIKALWSFPPVAPERAGSTSAAEPMA